MLRRLLLSLLLAPPAAAESVRFADETQPTRCAEEDNVDVRLAAPDVTGLRIEARHPPYLAAIAEDRTAPDFSGCPDMSRNPDFRFAPKTVILHDGPDQRLIGFTFERFWRHNPAPVTVAGRSVTDLHLLQLWIRAPAGRFEEVLVLYPADGYWRARPMAPPPLAWTAYGSSFLVGPVTVEGRPLVDLAGIAYDPTARRFDLAFRQGGTGSLALARADAEATVLAVGLPQLPGRPFAALRSMYVAPDDADVTRLRWDGGEAEVGTGAAGTAAELWAGRPLPSRHNTSAPDMRFFDFSRSDQSAPSRRLTAPPGSAQHP